MVMFLTSNLNHYHKDNGKKVANEIDNTNGLVDQIKAYLKGNNSILFISANSKDIEKNNEYSSILFNALRLSNITFKNYNVLNDETKKDAKRLIEEADFIFLSGGDTYIQNEFFENINLKMLLQNYDGIIMGQSAGALNMATNVFNSPEEKEESEPIYFTGLGLTELNIEPHFIEDTSSFDEYEVFQRLYVLEESYKRIIYALCDGSHILIVDGKDTMYGDGYIIENGKIDKVCTQGDKYNLNRRRNNCL